MSQTTIARAANDTDLRSRVEACVYDEAFNNDTVRDTIFAQQVRQGFVQLTPMYWAVAAAVEAEYEAGVLAGRGAPGHDADVVTDGSILAAVQAEWPQDPVATPAVP